MRERRAESVTHQLTRKSDTGCYKLYNEICKNGGGCVYVVGIRTVSALVVHTRLLHVCVCRE